MLGEKAEPKVRPKASAVQARGGCVCGAVRFEIDVPAVWAWHDHSERSRRAQGCAYATYVVQEFFRSHLQGEGPAYQCC